MTPKKTLSKNLPGGYLWFLLVIGIVIAVLAAWSGLREYNKVLPLATHSIERVIETESRIEEIRRERPRDMTIEDELTDPGIAEEALLRGRIKGIESTAHLHWDKADAALNRYRLGLWGGIAWVVICGSLIFWCYKREKKKVSQ